MLAPSQQVPLAKSDENAAQLSSTPTLDWLDLDTADIKDDRLRFSRFTSASVQPEFFCVDVDVDGLLPQFRRGGGEFRPLEEEEVDEVDDDDDEVDDELDRPSRGSQSSGGIRCRTG